MTVAAAGCSSSDDSETETDQSEDGSLTLELDPGEYELTIVSGGLQATRTFTVEEGQQTTATAELVAGTTGAVHSSGGINTAGYILFDENSEPEDPPVQFPPGDVIINGNVSDGRWDSTTLKFKALTVSGLSVQVEAVNGLSGTFDEDTELMTVEEKLKVTVGGDQSFSYDIAATTGESGALTDSAGFSGESGTATIVDNEYTVNDTTDDAVLNSVLGLPVEEPGRAWLELSHDFEFKRS